MNNIRICIVEKHPVCRKGLETVLNEEKNYHVCHIAEDVRDLLPVIKELQPDILLAGIPANSNTDFTHCKKLKEIVPSLRVVIFSDLDDQLIEAAIQQGINGFLLKEDSIDEYKKAIDGVMDHQIYYNDRISRYIIQNLTNDNLYDNDPKKHAEQLSANEIAILNLMAKEYTNPQIARELNKGLRTIEKYKTNMMEKTGAKNSVGLIVYAIREKIIKI